MTRDLTFAIPGDIATLTGGYIYDRRLIAELRALGVEVRHLQLPAGFPFPSRDEIEETERLLAKAQTPLMIDGLAFGALPPALVQRLPRPLIALTHHPLGLETGIDAAQAAHLIANETANLAAADLVIVTSAATADLLVADFAVPRARLIVAEPGTDPAPRAAGSGRSAAEGPLLMAAGSIIPRKGYDVLVDALDQVRDLPWRLTLIGSPNRAPDTAKLLAEQIERLGFGPRIARHGELSPAEMAQAYAQADIFVVPSLYEGFGMVLAEAMARGLPIICTTGGAAARTVPDAAAIKVAPGDAPALAQALRALIADPERRQTLAAASWEAGERLLRWPQTARMAADAVGRLA